MTDVLSKEQRSKLMSRIRSHGSKMEMKMEKALRENSVEFVYQPKIFGKPDFLVPPRIVVFCDSSFWHGRNWKKLKNQLQEGYWTSHIGQNRKRDELVSAKLKSDGYSVLRFWDTQINTQIEQCVKKIKRALDDQKQTIRESRK
ncbi:very short patch repair endonuclease [Candidatus Bathyarchaeota archaeon]|nr:very short patch repair endonuclease [Candidatus Bathyarchaeota archaeon]